jgi:uncharacterized membrane protein
MNKLSFKINWISVVMLLSLGINFFVIGFLFAGHKAKEIRMTRLSFDKSISAVVDPFPRSGKHEFYVTMKSKRADLVPIYKDIIAQRATLMTIIAEDQFDPAKFREAMATYHDQYHSMITESQEVIIKVVGKLEVEERKAILERYKNPSKRSSRDRKRSSNDRERSPSPSGF